MTFTPDLRKVNLGADAAEDDIKQGLYRYFVQSESFRAVSEGQKYILVGNRGAGKSAIFKYLAEQHRTAGHIVIELSPEEYSYDMLARALKKESEGSWGKQSSYSIAWQFLLYSLLLKEVASRTKGLAIGARKIIYDYVRDNLSETTISPIGMFVGYLNRLEGVKFGQYEVQLKKRELYKLYELEAIRDLQPSLTKLLDSLHVHIFVDELDKGWDNSEDARFFVAGLLQAAQKMNGLHKQLRVLVSIRQELFDNIPQIYDDAQKIRGSIETIRWSEESLGSFIALRLADPFPELRDATPQMIWNRFFEPTLDYRSANSMNYLMDRTQMRPREFLQLTRECISQLKRRSALINYDNITHAIQTFSENKTKDIASEYRFQHPGLLGIFELFRGKRYNIEKDDLDLLLLEICEGAIDIKSAEWVRNIQYMDLKRILWEIGFTKAWVVGGLKAGRKSGSAYLGHYELSTIALENITRFQVHPAFWAYLSLKEK